MFALRRSLLAGSQNVVMGQRKSLNASSKFVSAVVTSSAPFSSSTSFRTFSLFRTRSLKNSKSMNLFSFSSLMALTAFTYFACSHQISSDTNVAQCAASGSAVPFTGLPGTLNERTFIAIKPDGVQRGLVGEVISRFEKKGYKLVAMKLLWPTKEKAASHYDDLKARPFFAGLVEYFSSGPIIAMVWEGKDAILTGRKLLGATNPNAAEVGTIRGDFCVSVGRNLIHGSDGPQSAVHEISNWFTAEEVYDWPRTQEGWISAEN